jgi:hypothetical protein
MTRHRCLARLNARSCSSDGQPIQGGTTDFYARLDGLQQRVAAARSAAQAAATESREQLRQRIDKTQTDIYQAVKNAQQHADQAAAGARSK